MNKLHKDYDIEFPMRISMYYLTVSLIWIAFSDRVVESLFSEPHTLSSIQTLKGWGFVLFTAFLLYLLTKRHILSLSQAQHVIHKREQQYQQVFEANPQPMWVYDPTSLQFIDVNQAAIQRYGYSRSEFLSMTLKDIRPQTDIPQLLEDVASETNQPKVWKHRIKEGSIIDVEIRANTIEFDGRELRLVLARDVTEIIAIEERLEESERMYRGLVDTSPDAIIVYTDTTIRFINQAGLELVGLHERDVINQSVFEFLNMQAHQDLAQILHQTNAQDNPELNEFTVHLKDNRVLHLEISSARIEFKGEQATQAIIRDVTRRKEAETLLIESEQRFRILAEANIAGIYIVQDNIVQYANPAITAIFDYTQDEVIGKLGPMDFVHPDDRNRIIELMQSRLRGAAKEARYTFKGITKLGSIVYIEVFGTSSTYQGKPALIGTMIDVTERHNAVNALQRSEAQLRAIFDNTLQAFALFDRDKNLQIANRVAQQWAIEILGKPFEPGDNIEELYSVFNTSVFEEAISRVLAGESVQSEVQISNPNMMMWFEISHNPVVVGDEVKGVAMSALDITQRKLDEHKRDILFNANTTLTQSLDLDTVFLTILDYAQQLVDYDTCSVILPDHQNQMSFRVIRGLGEAHGYKTFEQDHYPEVLKIISSHRSVVVDDIRHLPHWHDDLKQYFRSWLGVPLVAGGTFLGLFAVEKLEPSYFTDAHIQDLEALAIPAAVAIQNAQLYQQAESYAFGLEHRVQERTAELQKEYKRREGLAKIELAINEQHELQTLMEQTVNIVKDVLDVTIGCSIVLWDSENDRFHISAASVPSQPASVTARNVRNRGGATRWVVDHGEPIIVSDTADDPFGANPMIINYGVKAYIGYPLIYNDEKLGVLYMLDNYTREYQADEINMLQQFAARVAVAINRVELYTQLSKSNQDLLELSEALAVRIERTITIVNSNSNGIVLVSIENGIQEVNSTFQTLTQSSLSICIDKPLSRFVCPEDHHILERAIEDALKQPVQNIELCMIRSDGTTFNAEMALAPVAQLASENIQLVCTIQDVTERKQMESALRDSEQMLLNVIDNIPVRIFWKDRNSIYRGCNTLHAQHLGLESRDEFIGLTDFDFVPERAPEWAEADRQVMETGEPILNVEDYVDNLYDPASWMRFSKVPLRNASGEIRGILVTIEDITERKQAELELQQRERWYRTLARNLPKTTVLLFDRNYRYVIAEGTEPYAPQEMVENRTIQEVLPPDFFEVLFPIYQDVLNGVHHKIERTVHGKIFDQEFVPIFDDTNEVTAGLLVSRDVTEERQNERLLQENEERLRLLFDNIPDGILLIKPDGVIEDTNPALLDILGVTYDQIVNYSLFDLLPLFEIDPVKAQNDFSRLGAGQSIVAEYDVKNRKGQDLVVEFVTHPMTIQHQPRFLSRMRDITVRKQAEATMATALEKERELNELKSRFVSMASHEFRTPLASILAVVETLDAYRHKLSDDQIGKRLEKIKTHISYLTEIMEDVLLLARMQERRLTFNPVRLDLNSICRSVLDEFHTLGIEQDFIEYNFDAQLPEVYLDRKLIRQVMTNLISNAIKYSPNDIPITVNIRAEDNMIVVAVQDSGIGIPEEDLKHLFQPFHRASNVGTISGTGLGLVITKEAVELHDGTILVESKVNLGTTFIVQIPMKAEER